MKIKIKIRKIIIKTVKELKNIGRAIFFYSLSILITFNPVISLSYAVGEAIFKAINTGRFK